MFYSKRLLTNLPLLSPSFHGNNPSVRGIAAKANFVFNFVPQQEAWVS
jgi:hypothetical protein